MLRAIVLSFCLMGGNTWSAPLPMTSSSRAIAPYWGIYRSEYGFQLDGRDSGWNIVEGHEDKVFAMFVGPKESRKTPPLLTVRVDTQADHQSRKEYIRSWLMFYERLGMRVLGHQDFDHNGDKAYVVDAIHPKQGSQIRQAIFFNGKNVIVLTCTDAKELFKPSLAKCNQIIKSLSWIKSESTELSIHR